MFTVFCCCCCCADSASSHKCGLDMSMDVTQVSTNFPRRSSLGAGKLESLGCTEALVVYCAPPNMTKKSVVKLQPSQSLCQTLFQTPECNPVQHTMHFALISDSNGGPRPQPQQLQPQPLSRCSRLLSTCADKHISPFDGIVD